MSGMSPANGHALACDWQFEQYPFECKCGAVVVRVKWHASDNPNTIWNRLKERLGREPTEQEAADEVKRILADKDPS